MIIPKKLSAFLADVTSVSISSVGVLTVTKNRYEGTITQFTNDSIMALFGASMTHEDHAGRALHAALGIQAAMHEYQGEVKRGWGVPLQIRLGLHTGTVVVGRIGDNLQLDYTVQGAGFVWGETFTALMLGEGYWLAGAYDSARQTLEALLDSAEQHGMQLILASAHRLLGEIALATNPAQHEAPLAAPHFERSMAILQQIGAENKLALTYVGYGRLHQQRGDLAQARVYLMRALAIFERLGTLREPDRIRQLLALQEGMC